MKKNNPRNRIIQIDWIVIPVVLVAGVFFGLGPKLSDDFSKVAQCPADAPMSDTASVYKEADGQSFEAYPCKDKNGSTYGVVPKS